MQAHKEEANGPKAFKEDNKLSKWNWENPSLGKCDQWAKETTATATMGNKSVETLGSKNRFRRVLVTFSPLPPKTMLIFVISSIAQTTAPSQHWIGGPGVSEMQIK